MPTDIDEKVVQMSFDNQQFEKGVSESMSTLDKLKKSLKFENATDGLEEIQKSFEKFDLKNVEESVEKISHKFDALSIIGINAMDRIANAALDAGKKMLDMFTGIQDINLGKAKYETQTRAVQTITNATGKSVEEVEKVLAKLAKYTDETSYDFAEMVKSIGKFTSVGVELEKAELAMEGIANEAAKSGANKWEANRAMYNFAQALSTGSVKLIDWKSIENANMATKEFKETLIQTAIELGTLEKKGDTIGSIVTTNEKKIEAAHKKVEKARNASYKSAKLKSEKIKQAEKEEAEAIAEARKEEEVSYKTFNSTLSSGWLTSDVLIKTLEKYGDQTTEFGLAAYHAAQEALTFTDAIDAVHDAVSSAWMETLKLLFGNLDEARNLWTKVANSLYDFVAIFSEARNDVLRGWHELGGYNAAVEAASNIWHTFMNIVLGVKEALAEVIPPLTSEKLVEVTEKIRDTSEQILKTFGLYKKIEKKESEAEEEAEKASKDIASSSNDAAKSVAKDVSTISKETNKAVSSADNLKTAFKEIDSGLKKGSSGKQVKKLQKQLNKLGLTSEKLIVDGIYGAKTEKAVKQFQKKLGIEQTGIFDSATKSAINSTLVLSASQQKATQDSLKAMIQNFRKGNVKKNDIKQLQEALNSIGVTTERLTVDGIYGPKTQAAVEKFEKETTVVQKEVEKTSKNISKETEKKAEEEQEETTTAMMRLQNIVKGWGSAISIIKSASMSLFTIVKNIVLMFKPLVLVSVRFLSMISQMVQNLSNSLIESNAYGAFVDNVTKAFKPLADLINFISKGIDDFITLYAKFLTMSGKENTFGTFFDFLGEFLKRKTPFGIIVRFVELAIKGLKNLQSALSTVFSFLFSKFEKFNQKWGWVDSLDKFLFMIEYYLSKIPIIGKLFKAADGGLKGNILINIKNRIFGFVEDILSAFENDKINSISDFFTVLHDSFKKAIDGTAVGFIIDKIESIINAVSSFIEKWQLFKSLDGTISVFEYFLSRIPIIGELFKDEFGNFEGGKLIKIKDEIVGAITGIIKALASGNIDSALSTLEIFLSKIPIIGTILFGTFQNGSLGRNSAKTLVSIKNTIIDFGKSIVRSFKDGDTKPFFDFWDRLKSLSKDNSVLKFIISIGDLIIEIGKLLGTVFGTIISEISEIKNSFDYDSTVYNVGAALNTILDILSSFINTVSTVISYISNSSLLKSVIRFAISFGKMLYTALDMIVGTINSIINNASNNAVLNWAKRIIDELATFFDNLTNKINSFLSDYNEFLDKSGKRNSIMSFIDYLKYLFFDIKIPEFPSIEEALDYIKKTPDLFKNALTNTGKNIATFASNTAKNVGQFIYGIPNAVQSSFINTLNTIGGKMNEFFMSIFPFPAGDTPYLDWVWSFKEAVSSVFETLKTIIISITSLMNNAFAVSKHSGNRIETIFETIARAFTFVNRTITSVFSALNESSLITNLVSLFTQLYRTLSKIFGMFLNGFDNLNRSVNGKKNNNTFILFFGSISNFVRGISDSLKTFMNGYDKFLKWTGKANTFSSFFDYISKLATHALKSNPLGRFILDLIDKINNLRNSLSKSLGDVNKYISEFFSAGVNSENGLISGLFKGIKWVADAGKNIAQTLFGAVCTFLGIHSPSTMFKFIGIMCALGLVGGLIFGLTRNIDKKKLEKAFESVKTVLKDIIAKLQPIFSGLFGALNGLLTNISNVFKSRKIDSISGFFTALWDGIKAELPILGIIFDSIGKAFEKVKPIFSGLFSAVDSLITNIGKAFKSKQVTSVKDFFSTLFEGILSEFPILKTIADTMMPIVSSLFKVFLDIVGKISEPFKNADIHNAEDFFLTLIQGFKNAFKFIPDFLSKVMDGIRKDFPLLGRVIDAVFPVLKGFISAIVGVVEKISEPFKTAQIDNIKDFFTVLISGFKNAFTFGSEGEGVFKKIKDSVQKFIAPVLKVLNFGTGKEIPVLDILTKIVSTVKRLDLVTAFRGTAEKIGNIVETILDEIKKLIDPKEYEGNEITDEEFKDRKDKLVSRLDTVKNVILSAIWPILGVFAASAVKNIASSFKGIVDIAKRKAGIKSDTVGTTVLKIAGAFAMLGGLVAIIAAMPADKVENALGIVQTLLVDFVLVIAALSAINQKLGGLGNMGTQLLAMTASIAAIAVGIFLMMNVFKYAFSSLGNIAAFIGSLAVIEILLVAFGFLEYKLAEVASQGASGKAEVSIKGIWEMSKGILLLVVSFGILAFAIKKAGLGTSIGAFIILINFVAILGLLMGFMADVASKNQEGKAEVSIKGFIPLAIAILAATFAFNSVTKAISKYGYATLGAFAIVELLMASMAAIAIIFQKLDTDKDKAISGAIGVISVAAALCAVVWKLVDLTKALKGLSLGVAITEFAGIELILATMGAIAILFQKFSSDGKEGILKSVGLAIAMIGMAAAVWIIANSLADAAKKVQNVDWKTLAALEGGIAILMGIMGGLAIFLKEPASTFLSLVAIGGGLAAGLALIGIGIGIFGTFASFGIEDSATALFILGTTMESFGKRMSKVSWDSMKGLTNFFTNDLIAICSAIVRINFNAFNDKINQIPKFGAAISLMAKFLNRVTGNTLKASAYLPIIFANIQAGINTIKSLSLPDFIVNGELIDLGASIELYEKCITSSGITSDQNELSKSVIDGASYIAEVVNKISTPENVIRTLVLLGSALNLYYGFLNEISVDRYGNVKIPTVDSQMITQAFNALSESIPEGSIQRISSYMQGSENDMTLVAAGINALGQALGNYATYIGKLNSNDITNANTVLDKFIDIDDKLNPKDIFSKLLGSDNSTSFDSFAGDIEALAGALGTYGTAIGSLNYDNVKSANEVLSKLIDVNSNLTVTNIANNNPFTKIWNLISGSAPQSLSSFSVDVETLGGALGDYADGIGKLNSSDITNANGVLETLLTTSSNLPSNGGLLSRLFEGKQSLGEFGANITALGGGIADYATAVSGASFTNVYSSTTFIKRVIDMLANIEKTGGVSNWWSGEKNIGAIGNGLADLGTELQSFATNSKDVKYSDVKSALDIVEKIIELGNSIETAFIYDPTNQMDWDVFSFISKKTSDFLTQLSDLSNYKDKNGNSMLDILVNMGETISGKLGDGIKDDKSKEKIDTAIKEIVSKITSSIKGDDNDYGAFKNSGKEASEKFIDEMHSEERLTYISNSVGELITSIINSIKGHYDEFKEAGKYLAEGLSDGLSDQKLLLVLKKDGEKLGDIPNEATRDALKVQSPSKEYKWTGYMAVLGLKESLDENRLLIIDAATNLGEACKTGLGRSLDSIKNEYGDSLVDSLEYTMLGPSSKRLVKKYASFATEIDSFKRDIIGNVDLAKRKKKSAKDMYEAGYKEFKDGIGSDMIATLYSGTIAAGYSDGAELSFKENVVINFTPIDPDGNVLDDSSMSEYLESLLKKSNTSEEILLNDKRANGGKNLLLGVKSVDGDDFDSAIKSMDDLAFRIHEYSETLEEEKDILKDQIKATSILSRLAAKDEQSKYEYGIDYTLKDILELTKQINSKSSKEDITLLQKLLNLQGGLKEKLNEDGVYDSKTIKAVEHFTEHMKEIHNARVSKKTKDAKNSENSSIDKQTRAVSNVDWTLKDILELTKQINSKSSKEDITLLQKLLNLQGGLKEKLNEDGVYGPKTKAAVKEFNDNLNGVKTNTKQNQNTSSSINKKVDKLVQNASGKTVDHSKDSEFIDKTRKSIIESKKNGSNNDIDTLRKGIIETRTKGGGNDLDDFQNWLEHSDVGKLDPETEEYYKKIVDDSGSLLEGTKIIAKLMKEKNETTEKNEKESNTNTANKDQRQLNPDRIGKKIKRPKVTTKDLEKAGYTVETSDDYSGTPVYVYTKKGIYSKMFAGKKISAEGYYSVAVTPVLENGQILSKDAFDKYINELLGKGGNIKENDKTDNGGYGIVLGTTFDRDKSTSSSLARDYVIDDLPELTKKGNKKLYSDKSKFTRKRKLSEIYGDEFGRGLQETLVKYGYLKNGEYESGYTKDQNTIKALAKLRKDLFGYDAEPKASDTTKFTNREEWQLAKWISEDGNLDAVIQKRAKKKPVGPFEWMMNTIFGTDEELKEGTKQKAATVEKATEDATGKAYMEQLYDSIIGGDPENAGAGGLLNSVYGTDEELKDGAEQKLSIINESTGLLGDAGGDLSQFTGLLSAAGVDTNQFMGLLGDAGIDVNQFAGLLSSAGGDVGLISDMMSRAGIDASALTSLLGDAGLDLSQLSGLLGAAGGDVGQLTSLLGAAGGDVGQLTSLLGAAGGDISQLTSLLGDAGGDANQLASLLGVAGDNASQLQNQVNELTSDSNDNSVVGLLTLLNSANAESAEAKQNITSAVSTTKEAISDINNSNNQNGSKPLSDCQEIISIIESLKTIISNNEKYETTPTIKPVYLSEDNLQSMFDKMIPPLDSKISIANTSITEAIGILSGMQTSIDKIYTELSTGNANNLSELQKINSRLDAIDEHIDDLDVYLDSERIVAGTVDRMDKALGRRHFSATKVGKG